MSSIILLFEEAFSPIKFFTPRSHIQSNTFVSAENCTFTEVDKQIDWKKLAL